MPNLIKITVQGYVTETAVWINGVKATLAYDGEKTYTTKIDTGSAREFHYIFLAQGFDGTKWGFKIEANGAALLDKSDDLANNFVRLEGNVSLEGKK
jgi:hypothetical protein